MTTQGSPEAWRVAARATGLGALSGARATIPLAQLAGHAGAMVGAGGPWPLLARPPVRDSLRLAALFELLADKLPGTASRLAPPLLAVRLASGAIAGAAVFAASRRSSLVGALLGAAAAYLGAHITHRLRVGRDPDGRPHPIRGVVEDALVVSAASSAVHRTTRTMMT